MSKSNKPRIVVCAACRLVISGDMFKELPESFDRKELIFCGPRHFDKTMWKQIEASGLMHKAKVMDQGFIDQYGVFMDRQEAMKVAKAARQPIDFEWGCSGSFDTLYSEGLY